MIQKNLQKLLFILLCDTANKPVKEKKATKKISLIPYNLDDKIPCKLLNIACREQVNTDIIDHELAGKSQKRLQL